MCTIVLGIVLKAYKHAGMQQPQRRVFAVVRFALIQGKTQPTRLRIVTSVLTPRKCQINMYWSMVFFSFSFFHFFFSCLLFFIFSIVPCFPFVFSFFNFLRRKKCIGGATCKDMLKKTKFIVN